MATPATPHRRISPASAPGVWLPHGAARRLLVLGLIVIACRLAAVALLGPLGSGVIDYRVTQTLRNQVIGLDGVSLFVVAPLALVAVRLVLRQRVLGVVLALGIGTYTSYMLIQYVLGPDYGHLAGNNQRLFAAVRRAVGRRVVGRADCLAGGRQRGAAQFTAA